MVAPPRRRPGSPSAGWCVADAGCRTRRRNAHGTGILGEREVLYRWHPWAGRVVGIHEVIERATGDVARCRVTPGAGGRLLEVPVWMFDRASCQAMWLAPGPRVDLAALVALRALFAETIRPKPSELGAPSLSTDPVPCAEIRSRDQNRGDRHEMPSAEIEQRRPPARVVRSDGGAGGDAALERSAGRDAADPDRLDDTLTGRAPAMPADNRAAGDRR
jgi:hypothetical protein